MATKPSESRVTISASDLAALQPVFAEAYARWRERLVRESSDYVAWADPTEVELFQEFLSVVRRYE
jgi:hypothetical protein